MITPQQIIDLIRSLPGADHHIHEYKGRQCITTEFLIGGFAGRCFESDTLEDAAQQLIDYLYAHINHKSIVGKMVTESGFPDYEKFKRYCLT